MMSAKNFHWEKLGIDMARVLKAMGDVNRMKIIRIIASNPDESVCVMEVAEMLGISQPATSQHIRVLSNVDILTSRRIKNRTYYSINSDQLRIYQKTIDQMFRKALERCTYEGDCDTCPRRTF